MYNHAHNVMYIADEYPAKTYLNDRYVTYTTHHSRQTISELPEAARENIVTITLAVGRPYRNSFKVHTYPNNYVQEL